MADIQQHGLGAGTARDVRPRMLAPCADLAGMQTALQLAYLDAGLSRRPPFGPCVTVEGWLRDTIRRLGPKVSQVSIRPLAGFAPLAPPDREPQRSRRQVVKRDQRPYWKQRGWRSTLTGTFVGWYRTQFGSWRGKAKRRRSGGVKLFIHAPPAVLENHSHWACFRPRSGGWYFIHMNGRVQDLSSAILEVERILTEAHTG